MVKAMIEQIRKDAHWFDDTGFLPNTLYLGGGTPSLLDEALLTELILAIKNCFKNPGFKEITIEANPEDIHKEKLHFWKSLGVDRVSLGIQTLHDPFLAYANRNHRAEKAMEALHLLCEGGIKKISADLMFGFPNQTVKQLEHDIKSLIDFPLNHLSVYCLTIEPNTVFGKRSLRNEMPIQDEEALEKQFYLVRDILEEKGFFGYEISNFAKPGAEAIHNSNYWKGYPYLGVGPSAHSFKNTTRRANTSNNLRYIKQLASQQDWFVSEELHARAVFNENMLTGLRRAEGLEPSFPESIFDDKKMRNWKQAAAKLCEENLLIQENGRLKLTRKGLWQADGVAMRLFA
jgi:oxygen-independent coproporphyrinogen-3 oxidase